MKLDKILNSVKVISISGNTEHKEITNITNNSLEVDDKSIFVAIKGLKVDGRKFIPEAISKGAKAVVLEEDNENLDAIFKTNNIVKILVTNARRALAECSCEVYGNPSRELKLIGITGSNGKTTTAFYIKNMLEVAGYKTGLLGTISNYIGEQKIESDLTTPESNVINKYIRNMVESGFTHCVMEVSSHALSLDRVYGLDFDYAVFTNITSDHMDFHSDFNNYFESKKILFSNLKADGKIVYNLDDKHSEQIVDRAIANSYSYGLHEESSYKISSIEYNLEGTSFLLSTENKSLDFSTRLVGYFNSYNASAAAVVGILEEIGEENIQKGISSTPQVPGRFEVLSNSNNNKKVIVDYSHTSDSLMKALESLKHIVKGTRPIYTVFGCGGDRDKSKRPIMGKIASDLSDKVYVTSDNPRSEDPLQIIEEIMSGIKGKIAVINPSREDAIKNAICESESNAVILIAGKGHEEYQLINGVKKHFSDKETALKYLGEC